MNDRFHQHPDRTLPIREYILNNSIVVILFRSIDVEQSRANFPKLPDTYNKEILKNDTQKHLSSVYI